MSPLFIQLFRPQTLELPSIFLFSSLTLYPSSPLKSDYFPSPPQFSILVQATITFSPDGQQQPPNSFPSIHSCPPMWLFTWQPEWCFNHNMAFPKPSTLGVKSEPFTIACQAFSWLGLFLPLLLAPSALVTSLGPRWPPCCYRIYQIPTLLPVPSAWNIPPSDHHVVPSLTSFRDRLRHLLWGKAFWDCLKNKREQSKQGFVIVSAPLLYPKLRLFTMDVFILF